MRRVALMKFSCQVGCKISKKARQPGLEDPIALASETSFSVNEVEALYELYKKLSSSVFNDGLIQKEELQLALFKNSKKQNLFADRIFDLFDIKQNGHIEFGEFVRSLSIFHPKTPESDKIAFAFRLYDLRHTGYIEREELKEMVLALINESDLILSDDIVETIVDKVQDVCFALGLVHLNQSGSHTYRSVTQTFMEVDTQGDGRIDQEEWKEYVAKNPTLLKNMTLPYF